MCCVDVATHLAVPVNVIEVEEAISFRCGVPIVFNAMGERILGEW